MAQDNRKNKLYVKLAQKVAELLSSNLTPDAKLKGICKLLKQNVSYYDWVGFYFVDKEKSCELVLGPFEGEPTEHVRIPFGKGVCGQAALLKNTVVVKDVSKEQNYLPCSTKVKSEIVVPIFSGREVAGELDIDSHIASAFTKADEVFLEAIAKMIRGLI